MKLRRVPLLVSGVCAVGVIALACSDMAGSNFLAGVDSDGGGQDSSFNPPPGVGDGGATGPTSGVVLIHAAAFPAFRLCFEGYPGIAPQPDAKVLPQANVVGIEMGSVVRIGAMTRRPGKVYVFDQTAVVASPNDPAEKTCGQLLEEGQLRPGKEYEIAGTLEEPLGVNETAALALTGCGRGTWLADVGATAADCGDYDPAKGTLALRTFRLPATRQTTATQLPVELVTFSEALMRQVPDGSVIDVSFGDLDAGPNDRLAQPVTTGPALLDASSTAVLELDLAKESTFGTHGFRIAYRTKGDAGAPVKDAGPGFKLDQTLAEIQAVSRPDSNPTTYFLTPSNYALLLLGDPAIRRTTADGGANPDFDSRRALHLLAVPVREESDAGVLGGLNPGTP